MREGSSLKICLYAVREQLGWRLRVSLDMRVDMLWWTGMGLGENSGKVDRPLGELCRMERGETGSEGAIAVFLLSGSMPLGWAIQLRDSFVSVADMDRWTPEEWLDYIRRELREEMEMEQRLSSEQALTVGRGGARGLELLNGKRVKESADAWKPEVWLGSKYGWIWNANQGLTDLGRSMLGAWTGDEGLGGTSGAWSNDRSREAWGEGARRLAAALEGRSLLEAELQQLIAERLPGLSPAWRSAAQLAHLQGRVQLTSGVAPAHARSHPGPRWRRARGHSRCRRCGSVASRRTPCGSCGCRGCAYCEACLALGRSRACALLLRGSARAVPPPYAAGGGTGVAPTGSLLDRWGLSPAQRSAAGAALGFLAERQEAALMVRREAGAPQPLTRSLPKHDRAPFRLFHRPAESSPPRFLLWAVTGAGKTEMIFPLLRYVLDQGGRVMVATPRRDVVLELAPRIAKAFPGERTAVLYGGSTQRWEEARLVLSTTHQLMRFYEAFDLVIIDELDAFPYHNDPMLSFAAEAACKPKGNFILLSATPPATMQREIRAGMLAHAKVPARYHGHPLPVPQRIAMSPVHVCLRRQSLPVALLRPLQHSIRRGAQIFLFVTRIRQIAPFVSLLRRCLPGTPIEGTSSEDKGRTDKVLAFRAGSIRLLVTTTILERGVTVPKSDVYIMDADSDLFDEASLVQMAGRAGRSSDDPVGTVIFASPEWTKSQRGAVRQIRLMNATAKRDGFLKD